MIEQSRKKRAFSLVEVLLAAATFSLIVMAVIGALVYSGQALFIASQHRRAGFLAEEGIEASRSMADSDYGLLATGDHGLAIVANKWSYAGTSDSVDGFTRVVTVSDISASVKNILVTITWPITSTRQGSFVLESRLTNWRSTVPAAPKWQSPALLASLDLASATDGFRTVVLDNYAYIVKTDGAADFFIVDVTNPNSPIITSNLTLNGAGADISVSGNYAYVASSDDNQELQVINVSSPAAPALVGSYNATGTTNATGVIVSGNQAYLTRLSNTAQELYAINITNPAVPTLSGSLELGANANDIAVIGNYAYIASANNAQELQIANISNPISLSLAGFYNASGNTDATRVEVSGLNAFITRGNQLLSINATNVAAPTLYTSYGAVGTISDLAVDVTGGFVFLATQSSISELEVVTNTVPATPTQVGVYNIAGNTFLSGLAYHSIQDKLYGVGPLDTQELFIWSPY